MDDKIVKLAESENDQKLIEALSNLETDELDDLIDSRVIKGKDDPLVLLRAIFKGSPPKETASQHRRLHVFIHCIDVLQKNDLSNRLALQIVGLLMLETDNLPGLSLAELATKFVDTVKNGTFNGGKSIELFPKVLSSLASQERIMYGNATMKGEQYKSHVINSLCSGRWSTHSIVHLAAMFKDVQLSQDELKFVIQKIVRSFKDFDIQDLPALIYQLLLLSSKGHKRLVLEGVTSFFIDQDKLLFSRDKANSEDDLMETSYSGDSLRHTEGTIIIHTMFAMKQDHELGRELVKYLKACQQNCPSRVLAPFNLALALSAARIHRFEDQIFDFLKATILKSFKDDEKQDHSRWVRDVVTDTWDIQALVLETVQNSKYGWDYVTQGLVQLGFILMDSFGPKAAFGRIQVSHLPQTGPSHSASQLGAKILKDTFKVHEVVRSEILEQIFNRVITKATSPVSHYLDLLSQLVQPCPQILLDSIPKVREALDYLAFLPPCSAEGLLTALQPLLKLSMSLKDALLLVLRKAMFSKQLDARKIGVNGFLMLLKHFRVLGGLPSSQSSQSSASSSSQVMVDVHCRPNAAGNEALCLEILGNLRRCFTQQADVRLILYQGLYEVLCRNSQLHEPILDLLLNQVRKYYEEEDDVLPPLKLSRCLAAQSESVYLTEPLAHLIGCICLCLLKSSMIGPDESGDHDDLTNHSFNQLEKIIQSLTDRMIKCEMEDFELDKSADFTLTTSVGKKNSISAVLVMGVYETLMEYNFIKGQHSTESSESVIGLYANYEKLSSVLKEKATSGGGKKGRSGTTKPTQNLITLNCLQSLLKALYSDNMPEHQESIALLRDHTEFCHYVMIACVQKLQQIQQQGRTQGLEGSDKIKQFNSISQIGRVLLKYYVDHQQGDKKARSSGLVVSSLEGTVLIVQILCSQYNNKLNQGLQIMESTTTGQIDRERSERISSHISRYQRLVANLLSSKEEEVNVKDLTSLLSLIGCLYKKLPPGGDHYKEVYSWVKRLCTEQEIDNISVCKLLFTHVLVMSRQSKSCLPILRDIAQDVHTHLGDIDQDVQIEDTTNFSLITPRVAAPTLVLLMLQEVETELDDTEWIIARIRADYQTSVNSDDEVPGPTQSEHHEKSVCTRLGSLITVFHELVQSAIPVGLCSENTLKQSTRLYNALATFVKFYLTLYTQKIGHVTSKFEKLVKLSGTHLTQQVYAFITYVQTSGSETLQEKVDKGKKDKKKTSAALQSGRAKVMKESRLIPNLIFAIEQYERYLIQLTKKSKLNLMEHIKQSTSRDFRINIAALDEAMEPSSDEEENSDQEEVQIVEARQDGSDAENQAPDQEEETNPEPPAKKSKLGKNKGKQKK